MRLRVSPNSRPLFWLIRLATLRPSAVPASTLPPSLLFSCWPLMPTSTWLEISPARLSMSSTLSFSAFVAPTKPPWLLSRLVPVSVSVPWATSSPPCWVNASMLAFRSLWLAMRPALLSTTPACSCTRPRALSSPLWLSRRWPVKLIPALLLSRPCWRLSS
ncbi:hypothetical protein D3C87_1662660 [compost metagenome]